MPPVSDWNPFHEAIKASFSLVAATVALCLGWFVGQRLTYFWNIRQKRRELQLSASQQFYAAYGEFFAVWKIWNRLDELGQRIPERRWELYQRAAAAEAIVEGILVKVASELALNRDQIGNLGRFRQAFQQLRESIRDDRPLPWNQSESPEYKAFKTLAVRLARLLAEQWPTNPPELEAAESQLMEVTSNRWEKTWAVDLSDRNPVA